VVKYAQGDGYAGGGAGVSIYGASPQFDHCSFRNNASTENGGGVSCQESEAVFNYCSFSNNTATGNGGGLYCDNANPVLNYCTFTNNSAGGEGGGIFCTANWTAQWGITLYDCVIDRNVSGGIGGGIECIDTKLQIFNSTITRNQAGQYGGGIYYRQFWAGGEGSQITNCMVADNQALGGTTGGVYIYTPSSPALPLANCIFWGNQESQYYSNYPQIDYSDVQGGWAGIGNLNSDPLFVATEYYDFRLQWGSPCIDAGHPSPTNNDPDGTRGDIGPFYYDQSVPVRALLTPHERSIVVPPNGGSFDYTLWLTNIDPSNPEFTFWIDITLPYGPIFGPALGPLMAQLDSGVTDSRERTQFVPARAPEGMYSYNVYAVVGTDTSRDSFSFFKMEPAQAGGITVWKNAGESLENLGEAHPATSLPLEFALGQNYPNPFNPTTAISYQLSANGHVSLRIYDTAGRLVTTLVSGWREAGSHQVTWDASGLPSGLYFCRVQAGDFSAVQKLILLK
jgi:predicted outer membrane repeat protein